MINIQEFSIQETFYISQTFSILKIKNNNSNFCLAQVINQLYDDPEIIFQTMEFFITIHHPSYLPFIGYSMTDFKNNKYLTIVSEGESYIPFKRMVEMVDFNQELKSHVFFISLSIFRYFKLRKRILTNFSLNLFVFDQNYHYRPRIIYVETSKDVKDESSFNEDSFVSKIKAELHLNEIVELSDIEYKKSLFLSLTPQEINDYQLALDGDINKCIEIGQMIFAGKGNFPRNENEGIHFLKYAADHGNTNAQVLLTSILINNPHTAAHAIKYCQMAVDGGDFGSLSNLGIYFLHGKGVQQNTGFAVKCFRIAAEHGIIPAILNYAHCISSGIGVEKDITKALSWYKIAADKGVIPAMRKYAELNSNKEESIQYYKMASDLGDIESLNQLGDLTNDLEYYKKAADLGNAESANKYAYHKSKNNEIEEAIHYFKLAAEKYDSTAIYNYSLLLHQNDQINEHEMKKIVDYYEKSILSGDSQSMINLGEIYEDGDIGIEQDISKAFEYFKKASDAENDEGSFNCGRILEDYYNDDLNALLYYQIAAEDNNIDAILRLVKILIRNNGGKNRILSYLNKAVEFESAEGMYLLGTIYSEGQLVEQDLEKARELVLEAEKNGYQIQ